MKQLLPMTINALSFFYDITLHWVTLKGRQGFLNSSALILPQYQILCAIIQLHDHHWIIFKTLHFTFHPLQGWFEPVEDGPKNPWWFQQKSPKGSSEISVPRSLTRNLNQRIITGEELGFVTSRTKWIHTSTSLYLTPFHPILDVDCDWILILKILMIFLMIKWMSMSPEIWKIPFHWKK